MWGVLAAVLLGGGMMLGAAHGAAANETMKRESGHMQIEQAELANGMKVVMVPDHRAPVVLHSVWYKVGSMDEPEGSTGLSHMLEHLMFKGTHTHPAGEMDKIIQRNGGVQNAFTYLDMTAYHQTVAKDKLPLVMELEADRMRNLVLSDAVFQPERSVVAEERKLRTDSKPMPRFFEALRRAHYAVHPYGHPVIGWEKDIQAYTFEKALDWYKEHYAPNNATLLVVGDVEMADVLPLAQKYYGVYQAVDVPARKDYREPLRHKQTRLVRVDGDVKVPVWVKQWRVPSAFQGVGGGKVGTGDAVALWTLSEIVGGGDTARLYKTLVMDKELADAANSDYDAVSTAEGSWDVSVTPKNGVTLDKIEAAVKGVMDDVVAHGVTQEELDRAKTNLLAEEIYARDDADSVMWKVGTWMMAGGDLAHIDDWQDTLRGLTVADVNRVAKTYFSSDDETTVGILVGNKKQLGSLKE